MASSRKDLGGLPNKYTYSKFGSRSNQNKNQEDTNNRGNTYRNDQKLFKDNDYSNNYVHSGTLPTRYIRNSNNPLEGYPKLNRLHQLKRKQILNHSTKPYGARVSSSEIIPTLNKWIDTYGLKFDVIMIGALIENQFILPLLMNLPIHKLCSRPGYMFIWATTQKIQELTKLLNKDSFNKKFRRSEELIFLPLNKESPYYPSEDDASGIPLLERQQWHCWMCITGTVRRSTDSHLIHCNIDTDLQIESEQSASNNVVPDSLYRVAENFSNSNRRLHIIPTKIGYNSPIKLRLGWVIMSPDVLIDNFNPRGLEEELFSKSLVSYKNNVNNPQFLVPQTDEIEELRPKSPVASKS
ncbi:uncharacterized protein PRCAT00003582001 [Priceomyces carsonii]|uniref:uncharacterized protein n=1 Tax=Priceomyces carsonii TaxID=28549 RepID=UPI002EDB6941|nr:unnamed protein product [Priceomyces carsonii]